MSRLIKIASSTALGFVGVVVATFGVHFWFEAHRTVLTVFDAVPSSSDPDAVRIDNADPWLDKDFILHRIVAAVVLLFGISLFGWAVTLMRKKREHDLAT